MSEVRPEVVAGLEGILGRLMDFARFAHPTAEEYTLAEELVGLGQPTATSTTTQDRHLRLVPMRP